MRVLAVTPLYPPASRVGAWLATHQFLRHLATVGHDVSVVATMARDQWVHDGILVEAGCRGRTAPKVRSQAADVVISHAGDGGRGATLAEEAGKPSVVMVHGAGYDQIPAATSLAVFNSESLRAMTDWSGPSIVCHPPTFPDDHRVPATGDAVTIVNCSQDKGIKTAWRAADQLPDHRFLGVKGGYGYQLTPRASNFEIIPTQQDMRAVWARTRVLLVPSAYETWGMVGVEAMCSGIPVIAHPTAGLRESLGDAGIFVDRDDTDGWVEQIRRLDDPAEYEQASAAATKRAAELDPDASITRFTQALKGLL